MVKLTKKKVYRNRKKYNKSKTGGTRMAFKELKKLQQEGVINKNEFNIT